MCALLVTIHDDACYMQARRLRHRVERLKRKRQWRKVVSEVTRARTEGVPLIESAQTLVLESYARDGRWREAIATLHEAHVKVSAYASMQCTLQFVINACRIQRYRI
jgi:hypothetical protein